MDSYSMNSNLYLLQSTTVCEHLFCGIRVKLLGCEQCRPSFCSCIFSGFDLCFWGLPFVLGFCHSIIAILTCASVNLPSCGVKCWLPWWWWDKRTLFHWHCRGCTVHWMKDNFVKFCLRVYPFFTIWINNWGIFTFWTHIASESIWKVKFKINWLKNDENWRFLRISFFTEIW